MTTSESQKQEMKTLYVEGDMTQKFLIKYNMMKQVLFCLLHPTLGYIVVRQAYILFYNFEI